MGKVIRMIRLVWEDFSPFQFPIFGDKNVSFWRASSTHIRVLSSAFWKKKAEDKKKMSECLLTSLFYLSAFSLK
jgi:hypothetical protein